MATPATATLDSQVIASSEKALNRYERGYNVARAINGLGLLCKFIGLLAGIFVVFFGVMGSATVMRPNLGMMAVADYETQRNLFLVSVVFFGALVAFIGWVLGVLISGYSEQLKANLDQAVHTSPFLTNLQRAKSMRLS